LLVHWGLDCILDSLYDFGFKDSKNESGWPLMGSC
jgi:hypothetical protein